MALLGQAVDYPMRHTNKEPEWSSLCNNVFDQYLDTDDLFGFDADGPERSSSNDSGNLFDFSTGSEQSHQTSGTSPIPSWCNSEVVETVEAQQPQAKEPVDFWTKTLRALEQNAAESEKKQLTLRSAKSHPDFLSLVGCPSPPAIPSSPTDQSLSVQRCRSRDIAANGRKASQARSLSRGRPTGVTKSTAATTATSYATARKCSASPPKMMTPSRYCAGFKDVWTERVERSPQKYELRVPSQQVFPASPPPSARLLHENDHFAAFGSPPPFVPLVPAGYDDQLSPLTSTFQQAHIHTPTASPATRNELAHAANSYFDDVPPVPTNLYAPQTVPLNDTAPLFPERTSSLVANKIQAFDFGFASSPDLDAWSAAPFAEPAHTNYTTNQYPDHDPFADLDILPSTEQHGLPTSGLGISCDPSTLVSNFCAMPDTQHTILPSTIYQPAQHATSPYYVPPHGHYVTEPNTPHRRSESRRRSDSPSPPMTDNPRAAGHRATSRSRRSSRHHRRTKSSGNPASTQRHSQNLGVVGGDKAASGGGSFVNYTPHDCNKILSGVAPSGSSKTKARREKEAADKRRKLSEAAVRAVVDAGGDLDCLAKAGLLA
ncbi:hypothetical protein LTR36_009749 [Oleoguttula mirabilis]|uniref:Developmental regulatory protein wetA n=1 Tax=Oleoguttula mirabilis TaxID=1507867 RepID=A0AAV9J696_9PEZI|nr:hypothetical protein LTR36_009749 [Oleoguttula mirabilis]